MPADASIFQNFLRAPKSVQDYDNEAMQAQSNALAMKTQQAQYNALAQQQQQEDAIKNYLGGGANLATPEGQSGLYRVAGSKAGSILKDQSALAKDRAAADKDKTESGLKVWQAYRDQASMIRNPQEAAAWITTGYNDPVIGPFLQRLGSLDEGLKRIPQDQVGFEAWRNGVGMNVDKLAEHALQQQQLDETVRHNTTSEGIMERNNIRSNERMIGNGGGGGVAMSKPFELTGEDGQQVVVQQDKQGNIRPVQGFSPKPAAPNAAQQKELMSINQQRSIVNGALNAVTSTPGAFTFKRGVAGKLPFGETLAGRTETPQETQARAYVFNNVSRVINERAGAAQSAQELARLNSFLPADTDGPEQIKNKLNGFITYLNDLESGTRGKPTQAGGAPQMPTKPAGGAKFLGYE